MRIQLKLRAASDFSYDMKYYSKSCLSLALMQVSERKTSIGL